MRSRMHWTRALACVAVAALCGAAHAADAVKLEIEPPRDTRNVEAGDPGLDLQIVGIDAAGARAGFGDKKLETSVTDGDLVLVEAPYKFRYVPPATTSGGGSIKISAWLRQTPDVRGELTLPLVPHRPYERLVLVAGNTAVQLGTSVDIEIRGVRADGSSALVKDAPITVVPDASVGKLEQVAQGLYRFTAPPRSDSKMVGATAHLKASLTNYPRVAGDLSLVMSADAPPPAPGGSSGPAPTPTPSPSPAPAPAPTPPPGPAPAPRPAPSEPGLSASGNVKILAWRMKQDTESDFGRERIIPPAGTALLAPGPVQRLRIEVERDDVRKVELESYIGDKRGAPVHIDSADKDGRLRVEKNKAGRTVAIIEVITPEERQVILNLLLTTDKGEVLREEFVMRRGHDRDNDGERDRRKK